MSRNKKTRIKRIMSYFLTNRFSPQTEEEVQRWIIEDNDAETKKEASGHFWDALQMETDDESFRALNRFNSKRNIPHVKKRTLHLQTFSKTAAILVLVILSSGGYLYYKHTRQWELEYRVGPGETRSVHLPDGSQVWINSGSTIKYSGNSNHNVRTVNLDGEAYFRVQSNPSKPFIVQTGNLSVKVLGTRFNMKAYSGEPYATAILDEGRIEISTAKDESYTLNPNEQLRYNIPENEISISTVSDSDATNWMNGTLVFTNATLQEILSSIERRYNVTINPGAIRLEKQQDITVKFIKNDNLDDVMGILTELLDGITYKKHGNNILLEEQ